MRRSAIVSEAAPAEVAPGVFRLVLPLGIHGIPSVNAYLLIDGDGDTLVDCGIAIADESNAAADDGTSVLANGLLACGSSFDRLRRLIVTHAHIDHFGLAGEVVTRSDADLWMHVETNKDLRKYEDPSGAVDRRTAMLADHGLYGEVLEEASTGLRSWLPVMPSIGKPTTVLQGGERFVAADRGWQVVPTPGHSPGHVCLWSASDRLLCSGDHLLKNISPPVTFERGFERDPMGSYLMSLETVQRLAPALVLPGHGSVFADGAARAATIEKGKRKRLEQVLESISVPGGRTVNDLTAEVFRLKLTGAQIHFAVAEVLAYLAYWEMRGMAYRERGPEDVFIWRAVTMG
jgi:glyoxylase-like metal-dependent hydrolase (beta-lactamase superfamily II)